MFSNLKRIVTLTLLASAAGQVLAAPAPVSDLSNSSSASTSRAQQSLSESNVQRLERLLENRN
ncbi:tol-pal system protein, partial [Vibrio sp. V17_P4S1T151]